MKLSRTLPLPGERRRAPVHCRLHPAPVHDQHCCLFSASGACVCYSSFCSFATFAPPPRSPLPPFEHHLQPCSASHRQHHHQLPTTVARVAMTRLPHLQARRLPTIPISHPLPLLLHRPQISCSAARAPISNPADITHIPRCLTAPRPGMVFLKALALGPLGPRYQAAPGRSEDGL